jgi:hypothetical protein
VLLLLLLLLYRHNTFTVAATVDTCIHITYACLLLQLLLRSSCLVNCRHCSYSLQG